MAKTERIQPIPLSSLLDPTYRSPFSKLENFQLDMEISEKNYRNIQYQQQESSFWRKFQTSFMNVMSVFASTVGRSASNSGMSLAPWKPYKHCELLAEINSLSESSTSPPSLTLSPSKSAPESPTLIHQVRSGLECLRYLATHPLNDEKLKEIHDCKPKLDNPHLSYNYSASLVPHPVVVGGAAMMFQSDMSESNSPSPTKLGEGNFEIFFHSSSTSHPSQEAAKRKCCLSNLFSPSNSSSPKSSPSSSPGKDISPKSVGTTSTGCIRIETNWRSRKNSIQDDSRNPFRSVSGCFCSSSTSKGGTITVSCASLGTSPRTMATTCSGTGVGRRLKTESESSTDSFIEFSASVESTDSFCIVFETAGGCIDTEDDDWEDDEDDDDDESEDEDQVFNYSASLDDEDVDGGIFQADIDDAQGTGTSLPCHDQTDCAVSQSKRKKLKLKTVSFDDEHLVKVIEFEDDSESQDSRKPYWEVFARDRPRFQDRIFRTGLILEPILMPRHRCKIFAGRFRGEDTQAQ